MSIKGIISVFAMSLFLFLPVRHAAAGAREDFIAQLNEAKNEYYEKKKAIDDAVSELGRQWHMYQLQMHEEIKEDPRRARAIRAELWEGARKLSQQKRSLYDQLTPLRKRWYQTRMKIEAEIGELEKTKAKQWD